MENIKTLYGYNTRYASKQNLYKPKERTNSGKQTVAFAASALWDNIPVDLKSLNVFNFSKKLKHYLLSEQHSETLSYTLSLFCSTFISLFFSSVLHFCVRNLK